MVDRLHEHTTQIVSSYVRRNNTAMDQIPVIITTVFKALSEVVNRPVIAELPKEPAVPVRKSVRLDSLICLECGFKGKMLRRHLREHGLTPESYRLKWKLPFDYPMVAANYAHQRSMLARQIGLGRRPLAAAAIETPTDPATAPAPEPPAEPALPVSEPAQRRSRVLLANKPATAEAIPARRGRPRRNA